MRCHSPLFVIAFLSTFLNTTNINAQKHQAQQSPALASYGKLPLSFEPNQGQADSSTDFVAHGRGYALLLNPDRTVIALTGPDANSQHKTIVAIALEGANSQSTVSREDPQITRTNYFLGNDPSRWHTNIPNFGRIQFHSVYDGIDLVYYGHQDRLEHDFVLAPHADPSQIVFKVTGAEHLAIDPVSGDLLLTMEPGQPALRLLKPFTYLQQHSGRREISSNYRLLPGNRVAFSIGHYNRAQPLIIDPVLVYSTYLGGSGASGNGDQGNGIAVDSSGDAYIVGTTFSTNFPVTTGSFQTQDYAAANHSTVFISKLNPSGTALVYSTYLGGSGGDYGYGIALDTSNNAYVTGATYSTDFPVTCTALLPANPSKTAGASTAFVTELTANGDALAYSTYLGGSGGDVAQALAVDQSGNAYVTGYTYSSDFPVSDTAFQSKFAGTSSTSNAFVAKLNPGGTALLYATYLGGSGAQSSFTSPAAGDYGNAIAIDGSGDAYIAGSTASGNFPVTAAAFQGSLLGFTNAFVTELDPTGISEIFSTYLGGWGQASVQGDFNPPYPAGDAAYAIAIDTNGYVYVAGNTPSSNFPVTAGVLEGASDFDGPTGFVTKLNKDGSTLAYSTYLEGVGTTITGLAIDSSGTAYVTGSVPTISAGVPGGFQATPDALPTPSSNGTSAFVAKLNPSATELNYATLLGGSSNDEATALALDSTGDVFVTGNANSTDFPVTAGAFQASNKAASGGNAFVSQLALAPETGNVTFPALPTGIATTLTAVSPGQINLTFCGGDLGSAANAFSFGVAVSLTTAAAGPPPTGIVIFTDSFNYNFPNPYQLQVTGNWGSGDVFTLQDGESMDGPIGPFSVSWTAYYYGDAVYGPSSVSGSASSPGCPASPNSTGITKPNILSPHVELLSRGVQDKSVSGATSKIFSSSGAKFTPAPAAPLKNGPALGSAASSQQSPACLATPQTSLPVLSLAAGTYTSSQTLTITDATPGAAIYYTTDSSVPTAASTFYSGAITISATETIKAIAIAAGYTASTVASAAYTITTPAATPTFSPQPGTYTSAQSVTITDATSGAAIHYTTDGSTPTAASTLYSGAITVSATETISAIATASGYANSPVASAIYTITPPAAAPTFSPLPGTYTTAQTVTIADATSGAAIHYTTDGSTPTEASTLYSGTITVSTTETIKAIATASGFTNSPVASAIYTITPPAAAPTFSPQPGTYTSAQTVTIADAISGAAIYYTTDGSMPTAASTLYSGAIAVSTTETISAIATASGYANSSVASATYTINLPSTFSVGVSSSSLTIAPGQSGTVTISVTPQNGFSGVTSFSCTGLPAGVTCTFMPATITPSGSAPATTTLTVSASSTASLPQSGERPGPHIPGFSGPMLAVAFAAFGWRRRRSLRYFLFVTAAVSALTLFSGCGGSSSAPKSVTAKVSVIATSGAIQQTVPLTITIQ